MIAPPDSLPKFGLQDFKEHNLRKVRDLHCPIHGQAPRLRFEGANLRDASIRMSACCDALIGLANQKLVARD